MTQEEKARAYDEALEKARAMYGGIPADNAILEEIFPVLQRNDDYKILRLLEWYIKKDIDICESISTGLSKYQRKKILAYIEKQKESLHTPEISKENANSFINDDEDERIRKVIHKILIAVKKEVFTAQDEIVTRDKAIEWLEKQKEQIPYTDFVIKPHKGDDTNPYDMSVSEAQEYAINRGFGIPFNDGEVYVDERHMTQTIGNILRWADEHPKEQKPAEWSEEDERILKGIIGKIDHDQTYGVSKAEMLSFLKSLRPDSYKNCNSRWKPSEKQMKALEDAFRKDGSDEYRRTINSLYQDLKKLM